MVAIDTVLLVLDELDFTVAKDALASCTSTRQRANTGHAMYVQFISRWIGMPIDSDKVRDNQ